MISQLPVFDRIALEPSEDPAVELPELEPTAADLVVLETSDDATAEDRVAAALRLAACEQTHRELMALRRQLTPTTTEPDSWSARTEGRAAA